MFAFIWLIVSLPTNNDALQWKKPCQQEGYCVTFNKDEIRAEAGLCAVIPCSFTSVFAPEHIIWYKCEPSEVKCDKSEIIFHSHKNKENIQPGFKGRVSLMEPNVIQKNCSIMINDLKKSDSGSYQLSVEGSNDRFTYLKQTKLLVTDLNQKPSMMIPPLTDRQQATLTCTAPGLCSGSPPKITWMWRGKGEKDSYIIGNITALKTENLTAFTKRHVSTLTFNSSADHHNTNITCDVSFTGSITAEETVTLKVNYVRKPQISGRTTVMEGEDLNLTCSVDSVPPSVIKWTKPGTETKWQDNILNKAESRKVYLQEKSGHVSFSFMNVTTEEAGRYICTATYQNERMTEEVDVKVTYVRKPQISGRTTVMEGEDLNLTCSVDSVPPSVIKWTKPGTETKWQDNILNKAESRKVYLQEKSGHVSFSFMNVTTEEAGRYICTATYQNESMTEEVQVKVTFNHVKHCACGSGALPWVVAGVSLSVHLFSMIYLYHIWNTRKKAEPTEDNRIYMCMQKANESAEYDVIVQRPH